MCLAVPGKLTQLTVDGDPLFRMGLVSFGGVMKEVNLSMLPEARIGDYLMVHVGVALSIVDEEEARTTVDYLRKMGEFPEELEKPDES
ncbi:MAG: HypC/HybG/HupF family hydrogenase formation chaperone [Bacteroidota bacterium]|nr:HypC/HybG/HupF family hydrogenase formation chaperone [Bacteroidota bacterium]MDX5448799.1 HypC/HybG/HupF family hydrogenase formation chaperone [Bacteroidota bacterium]MDX5505218.1 HypC/HybG/HupF family hydrogenase formation chaperone [Bacteroidota bacterium]